MKVYVDGPNVESLRKALGKLRTPAARKSWTFISSTTGAYLCIVKEPTPEEEVQLLKYGELR